MYYTLNFICFPVILLHQEWKIVWWVFNLCNIYKILRSLHKNPHFSACGPQNTLIFSLHSVLVCSNLFSCRNIQCSRKKILATEAKNPVLLRILSSETYGPHMLSIKYNDLCRNFYQSIKHGWVPRVTPPNTFPFLNDFHWTKYEHELCLR